MLYLTRREARDYLKHNEHYGAYAFREKPRARLVRVKDLKQAEYLLAGFGKEVLYPVEIFKSWWLIRGLIPLWDAEEYRRYGVENPPEGKGA